MARTKHFDPLQWVPAPEIIRDELVAAETLAARLRILLELAERLQLPLTTGACLSASSDRREAACA